MAARRKDERILRRNPPAQVEFQMTFNSHQRVPADNPLRGIKQSLAKVLANFLPLFDELYAGEGRHSIPTPTDAMSNSFGYLRHSARGRCFLPRGLCVMP